MIQPIVVGDNNVNAWMVWSQHHPSVIYNLHAHFTKYVSCTWKVGVAKKNSVITKFFSQQLTFLQTISLNIVAHGIHDQP
jgi:hypothetical protein